MTVYYLRHPVHGAKVATLEMEVEFDERNGWEQYDPYDSQPQVEQAPVNTMARRRRKESENVYHGG